MQPPAAAPAATSSSNVTSAGVVLNWDMEQRDWSQLPSDLVSDIADRLLRVDVTEYIRVRAVCQPWRNSTADPRSFLDPRFFPRDWLLLAGDCLRHDGEPERFVNVRTGASLRIRLPDPDEYTHHGSAEGLLLLHHTLTDTVSLLNPLTLAFADLPAMAVVNDMRCRHVRRRWKTKVLFNSTGSIRGVGIVVDANEGSQPPLQPTVVLCLNRETRTALVCAKPGDLMWRAIDMTCVAEHEGKLPFVKRGLSVRGRFYMPKRAGDVLTVELRPRPHLAFVARQAGEYVRNGLNEACYLVPSLSDNDDGMLLVRITEGDEAEEFEEFMELFAVDLGNRSLEMRMPRGVTVFLPSINSLAPDT
ncbi:hypothetical protein EJB05_01257, partial [Eragrostis curvula]